jgi:hypothetical protein
MLGTVKGVQYGGTHSSLLCPFYFSLTPAYNTKTVIDSQGFYNLFLIERFLQSQT